MSSTDQQPLKKRRLYDYVPPPPEPQQQQQDGQEEKDKSQPPQEPPPLPPPQSQTLPEEPETTPAPPPTPPPLSQDEILTRRRNRDEIRSLYDTYNRLKSSLSRNEASSSPDLEQAYLSLISASRGCASVQRIVADLIPRYASYCLTALEAAAKVVINMYNLNSEVMNRGEDSKGVAFETAKSCVFGLTDICRAASSTEAAPTSSVIRGICAAVFQSVLSFFVSLFEGKDVVEIVGKEVLEIGDSYDRFCDLRQKVSEEDVCWRVKLSKCHVLSFVWVLFSCPKNLLAACFELFRSGSADGIHDADYFIHLLTSRFDSDKNVVVTDTCGEDIDGRRDGKDSMGTGKELLPDGSNVSGNAISVPGSCLLHVVLGNSATLQSWVLSKYKKLCNMPAFVASSETKSALEGSLESFRECVQVEDSRIDSDEDVGSVTRFISREYSVSRISNDTPGDPGSSHDSGGSRSMDFESGKPRDFSRGRSSVPRDLLNQQMRSPMARKPSDYRSHSFEGRNYDVNTDPGYLSAFTSPKHQTLWFYDGDPTSMDVFPAAPLLWLGYFGSDVSESHMRYQLERFGYLQKFFFFPLKRFALVEYRSLMDAVRCREHLRSHSSWLVKFMDMGLGTRGTINGVAVGSICCIYVGNISSQWARDEIIYESRKVLYKGPYSVTDLCNEGALLLEFETPEEATVVMIHLRQHLQEISNYLPPPNFRPSTVAMPHPVISSNHGSMFNHAIESPHARTVVDSSDSCMTRMSHLSSLIASLRAKCNINQPPEYFDNHVSGGSHTSSRREDDGVPSNTLWIYHSTFGSPYLTDDEIMAICDVAATNVGCVVKITRTNTQSCGGWFIECSNVDAAASIMKNLRACPGMFFEMEFSQPTKSHGSTLATRSEGGPMELISPRVNLENQGMEVPAVHSYGVVDPMQGGAHVASTNSDQPWMYKKNDIDLHPAPGSLSCMPTGPQGHSIPPPQSFQPPPFVQPFYHPPNSSWDPQSSSQQFAMNPISSAVMPNSYQGSSFGAPFVPAPVPPVAQVQQPPMQHYEQMFPMPFVPRSMPSIPTQPELPPPLPPSPPPIPPPPSSPPPPPPPPALESANPETLESAQQYRWQGMLCKSGVHYCTIIAQRLNSDICKYSNAISEPAEWPAKLDMTKRTDFQHVNSTFTSTPPNRREVCQLMPSTTNDQKGFQDFITYLKQRECAGVIKLPAARSMWGRLLFILPYSEETCSMLGVTPDVSSCLIALVLPKETNFEWV